MSESAEDQAAQEESNDMDESQEHIGISFNEVVDLEDELIEESTALLGAANDKACSYAEGYVKRQALYSCLTCIPEAREDPEKGAGVCLACSYHCHDGHELIELYTKRNFRCDCGNSKFPDRKCNLNNDKNEYNDLNSYNQNFSGIYCVCHRPFPDPEDPVPDEMIQCIICEDWYHTRHLGTEIPIENFAEMICEACVTNHPFLLHYDENNKSFSSDEQKFNEDGHGESANSIDSYCKMPKENRSKVCAKFWADVNWRKCLCTCDDCLRMYENEDIAFLLDSEDPVILYEEKGKAKVKVTETQQGELLNNMDRVVLMNCVADYNDLREQLCEYLKTFAAKKQIVTEKDIKEFFDGMNDRKK